MLSHYVGKAKEKRDISERKMVRLDEIAIKECYNHVTLFCDMEEARIRQIENGKAKNVFQKFRAEITDKVDHEQIQYTCLWTCIRHSKVETRNIFQKL